MAQGRRLPAVACGSLSGPSFGLVMRDPEEQDLAATIVGLASFSGLRTAADHSDPSLLDLQWNGLRFAAVPALLRDGGVLLVLPEEANDGVLALCAEQSLGGFFGFGLSKGRSSWLAAEGVRPRMELCLKPASPGIPPPSRCSPYASGESGGEEAPVLGRASRPALPSHRTPSGGDVPDSRLGALGAQVRELAASRTALWATRPGPGLGASGATRLGIAEPPLSEAEAGGAERSLEQPTALLGAAGRLPERLRGSRPTALTGASNSGHLTLRDSPESQAHSRPPGNLPSAVTQSLPTGVSSPPKGALDASSLSAAFVQQNNNPLEALTKNRSDSFGDYPDRGDRPSAGVRGYQARQQFQATPKRATLPGAALRTLSTNKVPLGSSRGITLFGFATAQFWEAAGRDDLAPLKAQVAPLGVYREQEADDGGRFQRGWFLTGMQQGPRWIAANLAYFQDADYLEGRSKLMGEKTPSGDPDAAPKQRPKPKAKGAPKAAAKPAAGGAGEAA